MLKFANIWLHNKSTGNRASVTPVNPRWPEAVGLAGEAIILYILLGTLQSTHVQTRPCMHCRHSCTTAVHNTSVAQAFFKLTSHHVIRLRYSSSVDDLYAEDGDVVARRGGAG